MSTRRSFLRSLGTLPIAATLLATVGCGRGDLISDLQVNRTTIYPNGNGIQDEADVNFTLWRRADVTVTLIGPDGKTQHVLRETRTRAPDQYQIPFRGVVPVPGSTSLRVVPDGAYILQVQARDASGTSVVRETRITVQNADTSAPEITNVVANPATFSPNGDGIDDTVKVSYGLTKDAQVRIYATDEAGDFYLIQPPTDSHAKLFSFEWDGTAGGGAVLKDGPYAIRLEATDTAGNFTDATTVVTIQNGGIPRAEIVDVKFSPTALAVGMDLHVSMTVRNTGQVPLKTLGPPPGTKYTTKQNFASFFPPNSNTPAYYERVGVWRVCVGWQNAPESWPVRWGFFPDSSVTKPIGDRTLAPGETVTVDGVVTVLVEQQRDVIFWAALEQGGVGFLDTQTGQKHIAISF